MVSINRFLPEQIGPFFDCDSVHYKLTDKMTSYDFRRDINLLTRKEIIFPSKCMLDLLFFYPVFDLCRSACHISIGCSGIVQKAQMQVFILLPEWFYYSGGGGFDFPSPARFPITYE